MRLQAFSPIFALFLSACGGHAGTYIVEAAPVWAPSPTPGVEATAIVEPVSPTATVTEEPKSKRKVKGTETPTPTPTWTPTPTTTPTLGTGFYLMPFQDRRKNKAVWSGRGQYENVVMEPEGVTLIAKSWRQRPYSDMSYLWQRQFAFDLAESGFLVRSAEQPLKDEAEGLAKAREVGAKVLINGTITRLNIVKRGADDFLGTNFSGTNYYLNLELQLRLVDVANGRVLQERTIEQQRKFYDPTRLGSNDRDTFPRYFATGLPEVSRKVVGDEKLREVAGLPTFTSTPTSTVTPEVQAPKAGDTPTPVPTATPDQGPYWVNPKTGGRVDPNWNFDPADGTPREKFVLRQPAAVTTPRRATEPK